ncbi:hypothetical protein [Sphingobium boeckii]|uniref:Terminase small subunit n=1 Tax=Sphingobium boeckii TaxID=1082345 RepID=A0A7W9EFQ5_9SPHN|nr:hypothetical protein [Sphingobium boeckii]MBB5687512.1 hypothetical protein [Sphingobium boeckii]
MSKHTPRKAFAPVADACDPPPPASPHPASLPAAIDDDAPPPEPYDPTDYRWVPVRRKPRLDGWTEEKQRRFIETLADTGLVNVAAGAVGMSRESAYRLRRSAHGAAFARAWDAARHHAGGLIEDIAFERAIEGTEIEVLDRFGNVMATRLVHDNRLLKYLLSHLRPERYGRDRHLAITPPALTTPAPSTSAAQSEPGLEGAPQAAAVPALEESLRAMEPALPAPPEQLLDAETLADELDLAEMADGILPHFLAEQRRPKTEPEIAAEAAAAREARGLAAMLKHKAGGIQTHEEFADECYYLDPVSNARPLCRSRRKTPTV